MLSHLVYVSKRTELCTEPEIQKILKACQKNNGSIDVTGVLLYSDSNFLQYLEGDYKQIVGLYDKIKPDPRHRNAVMIASGPIAQRLFPSWQMGSKKINDRIEFLTEIKPEDRNDFADILAGKTVQSEKVSVLLQKFFK